MHLRKHVVLFADGACIPNPGPGGWAFRLQIDGIAAEMSGVEPVSTNLRMELVAVVKGLQHLKETCEVELVSDSEYIADGLTKWLPNWKKHQWKTSEGNPVKNLDLWMELDNLVSTHEIQVGRPQSNREIQLNARVDGLANRAAIQHCGTSLIYIRE